MIKLKAPAKINWFLFILSKRADSLHNILSTMQCINLYDTLTFEESEGIEVITESPIPLKENLVYKAMIALKKMTSTKKGARITLKKEIPLSSGLGGGSSDAACTLLGLNSLWRLRLNKTKLLEIAKVLGSDIPFFLNGAGALIGGKGEKVTPLKVGAYTLLLLKPDLIISSAWAYSKVKLTKKDNNMKLLTQLIKRGDFSSLKSLLRNDLEVPVIKKYPIIKELKQSLIDCGAVISAMSGSGPTVFGVFDNPRKAEEAASNISAHWKRVVKTLRGGNYRVRWDLQNPLKNYA